MQDSTVASEGPNRLPPQAEHYLARAYHRDENEEIRTAVIRLKGGPIREELWKRDKLDIALLDIYDVVYVIDYPGIAYLNGIDGRIFTDSPTATLRKLQESLNIVVEDGVIYDVVAESFGAFLLLQIEDVPNEVRRIFAVSTMCSYSNIEKFAANAVSPDLLDEINDAKRRTVLAWQHKNACSVPSYSKPIWFVHGTDDSKEPINLIHGIQGLSTDYKLFAVEDVGHNVPAGVTSAVIKMSFAAPAARSKGGEQ